MKSEKNIFFRWIQKSLRVLELPLRRKQERLMLDRESYSRVDFDQHFSQKDVPIEILDEIWNHLVEASVIPSFKPHPRDGLLETYGLADEDIDEDIILATLKKCNCHIPTQSEVVGIEPIETVADLVEFINRWKQKQTRKLTVD